MSSSFDRVEDDSSGAAQPGNAPQVSAGGLLRGAREASGMHIAALAVSLKVPVKKLEALEQDRFDLLPDAVFVRALAASVCRTLKLDPAPILERLPQTSAPRLTYPGVPINTPFRAPGDGPRPSVWSQVSRPAVLAGLVFVLGALVLILLPVIRPEVSAAKAGADESGERAAASSTASTMSPEPGLGGAPAGPAHADAGSATPSTVSETVPSGLPKVVPGPASGAPVSVSVSGPGAITGASTTMGGSPLPVSLSATPALGSPATAPAALALSVTEPSLKAPAGTQIAPPAQTATGILVFRAKGESWIEVTDAKGTVVLRRILAAGEVAGVSGVLPLAAVIGRADATQVQVRGKAFDLADVTKDNVARFEVK